MLYSTQAKVKQAGPRAIWPWIAVCLFSIFIVSVAYWAIWPVPYPTEDKLVKVGGSLKTSRIRDDITDKGGSMLPVLSSVYMRFKDDEHEYRYPWNHPKYFYVREYTFFNIDIWVDKDELARNDGLPVMIWALQEKNPHEGPDDQTSVTYLESVEQLEKNANSVIRLVKWLGAASILSLMVAAWTIRWNNKNYPKFEKTVSAPNSE
ncbi:MAG: hypothetical protein HON65_03090 [Rhodospirillales bacterium]|jgi:hypothetical protein|nr:hypothetical protein [Rhodospirillales bacterium]